MYLKRLEIYGFKTFAQRTILEFPPGVTAVVGPNGSGKSNVADAVRWVLGEQSFANLRSKRTDDLIYGGGRGRAPMGFAEVFLTIDNGDRLLPLPYDEVTIGRRAYRNGENEYTLNRARVRLRDVSDAVAPLGSSYTIINQGLVDTALALQPEERRRLFEDAAEIGPYQAKKHEAERRLRETEANLLRLSDLVSELEPQLRTLKRQARDAEAVDEVERELRGLLRHSYAAQWAAVTERLGAAEDQERRAARALSEMTVARAAAVQELQLRRDRLKQQRALVEQARDAHAVLSREQDATSRDLAVAVERHAGVEQRRNDLRSRREALTAADERAAREIERLTAGRAESEQHVLADRQRLAQAEAALTAELRQRRAAEADLAEQREALVRATAALAGEQARRQSMERRSSTLKADYDRLLLEREQFRATLAARSDAAAAARAEFEATEQSLSDAQSRLDRLRAELDQARREREARDGEITAAQRAHGQLQARFDALSRLARSFEGTYAGVRAAMQWAERGGRGFALVSALLRVPAELETAVEVALGARLQNIVVERWSDAEAAIAHLRGTGAGRATFLPLDILRVGRRLPSPSLPGLRGVAADLVAVEPRYAPINAYLLGRTLIADDLDAARRALPQLEGGWTIVTLSGEQIATGGSVTGGAATRESGTLRRERELRDLPQQLEAAQSLVQSQIDARSVLHARVEELQLNSRQAERALRDSRDARERAQRLAELRLREQHRAEDELAGLERRFSTVTEERAALEHQRTDVEAAVSLAESRQKDIELLVSAAERALSERWAALGNDETAARDLQTVLARHEAALRQLASELDNAVQARQRSADETAALDRQEHELTLESQQLSASVVEIRARHLAREQQLADGAAHVRELQAGLSQAEGELEALEARERELTTATLASENAHAEAAVELERRRGERDVLWERAAEDNIDVEQLAADPEALAVPEGIESSAALAQRIEQLRGRLRRMGPVNALAPEEYATASARHTFLTEQLADIRSAAASMRDAIGQLEHVMQEHFATTFESVAREFSRCFTQLFGGGTARLELLQAAEGGTGGVEIMAQPPGKRQINLQLLSGGERALTAAALLFAILTVNPSPFCILDEVDAALDEANVVRFREALLQLAERTQFILVTHNRGTVEAAETLYGITMAPDGASRVLSLRLQEIDETLQLWT